jgi:hypothetical protein
LLEGKTLKMVLAFIIAIGIDAGSRWARISSVVRGDC